MREDSQQRLRSHTARLFDMRLGAPGLWCDDALAALQQRDLKPHHLSAIDLAQHLAIQDNTLNKAALFATEVLRGKDLLIETGQSIFDDLSQVERSLNAAHEHIALSLSGDDAALAVEARILCMVQEANLNGFGGAAAA